MLKWLTVLALALPIGAMALAACSDNASSDDTTTSATPGGSASSGVVGSETGMTPEKTSDPLVARAKADPGSLSDAEWASILTPEQFRVTRKAGTERPFTNEYHLTTSRGRYECVCCGEVLFNSGDKFVSACGWPAFSEEAAEGKIAEHVDTSVGMIRTEVTCERCGAHLGHVFNDGPPPTGRRYCINSASIRFVPDEAQAPSVGPGSH